MTLGDHVCLVTLLLLVAPGSPERTPWRFPDGSPPRLDDKVRFVDRSIGGAPDLTKNRISDEQAETTRRYCVCTERPRPDCVESPPQRAACSDGTRLCCYTDPRTHSGNDVKVAVVDTPTTGQRPYDLANDGLFSPTREERPGAVLRDTHRLNNHRNKFYITYIEDYPGVVEPLRRPTSDSAVAHSYTLMNPYEPTFSVKSENYNKHRYFLADPDEFSGNNDPVGFGSGHGVRRNPPHSSGRHTGVLAGPGGPTGSIDPNDPSSRPGTTGLLVGPDGPAGSIGPRNTHDGHQHSGILIGPDGPTGIVGPGRLSSRPGNTGTLVGPDGPTGSVGPNKLYSHPDVLVGPGGPTGVVGPRKPNNLVQYPDVLVGPDGPTGIIGPGTLHRRPDTSSVLVGPGGPTGVIGHNPNRQYGRPQPPGVLVGPGGPTGIVGPATGNRHNTHIDVLVGPGGPSGIIGPGRVYGSVGGQGHSGVLVGPGGATGNIGPYYVRRVNKQRGAGVEY